MKQELHIDSSLSFDSHNCCVIIPTYNNDLTLEKVLTDVLTYTSRVIVVDDGSTDRTASILASFPQIQHTRHTENKGKGMALRTGFAFALSLGYDYAITIDSDGQHMPYDLIHFLYALDTHPNAIIVGARNMDQRHIPKKSSFGNNFSNFWFYVTTGIRLPDTQSGYRLYPIKQLQNISFQTTKFEFEIEVMVRAAWKGLEVVYVPVSVYYPPAGERISHFRPFRDFVRITALNTIFVLIAVFWYHPYRFFKQFSFKKIIDQTIHTNESAQTKSASVGFGLFMGIFPVWGYQMLIGVFLAQIFRLNKALVLLFSNISIPPMIPAILYASNYAGALVLGNSTDLSFSNDLSLNDVQRYLVQYLTGSILLSVVTGFTGYLLTLGLFKIVSRNKSISKA